MSTYNIKTYYVTTTAFEKNLHLRILFSSTVSAKTVTISDISSSRAVVYVRASERPTFLSPIDILFLFLIVNCQIMHFNDVDITYFTISRF